MSKQVDFFVKMRDACQMLADAANQYIQSMAPPQTELTAVQELTFATLKVEAQQGSKLGD
jgi:methionine aminopeptidase